MLTEKVLVRAIGEHSVSYRNESGGLVMGRFFGRDSSRKALPLGEIVLRSARNAHDLHEGVVDGELSVELFVEPKPAAADPIVTIAPTSPDSVEV